MSFFVIFCSIFVWFFVFRLISGQDIYCDGAYECVGQSLSSENSIISRGYKSTYGDTTSMIAGERIFIFGSFGAYQVGSAQASMFMNCASFGANQVIVVL